MLLRPVLVALAEAQQDHQHAEQVPEAAVLVYSVQELAVMAQQELLQPMWAVVDRAD